VHLKLIGKDNQKKHAYETPRRYDIRSCNTFPARPDPSEQGPVDIHVSMKQIAENHLNLLMSRLLRRNAQFRRELQQPGHARWRFLRVRSSSPVVYHVVRELKPTAQNRAHDTTLTGPGTQGPGPACAVRVYAQTG
jgi:hypothetical protein